MTKGQEELFVVLSTLDILWFVRVLTKAGYDVIFAPAGMFNRTDKRYDIFLLKDNIILTAELKCIHSQLSRTIENRIKEGSHQCSRVVIDIRSDVDCRCVINGLKGGVKRNRLLKEILLLFKGKLFILPKTLIESKNIYDVLK